MRRLPHLFVLAWLVSLAPASAAIWPPDNDAGTGGDASDSTTAPTPLKPQLGTSAFGARAYVGSLGGASDPLDAYSVVAREADKLVVTVAPEDGDVLTDVILSLYAPGGVRRVLVSDAPSAASERVELNLDAGGAWVFSVAGRFGARANYTMVVSVLPTLVNPPDAASQATCDANAARLAPLTRNALRGADVMHVYRVPVGIGDVAQVELEMRDLDGQDFDLVLRDPLCRVVATASAGKSLAWPGDVPKGAPDVAVIQAATMTGDHFVEVRRVVGVGAYTLTWSAGPILPTLPDNDATTGRDASDDVSAPTPIPGGRGAFEGRFHDGDPRDVYVFDVAAGQRAEVSVVPSPANEVSMALFAQSGSFATTVNRDQDGRAVAYVLEPSGGARIVMIVVPLRGGGNYALWVEKA